MIELRLGSSRSPGPPSFYRVAGRRILADRPLPELEAFAAAAAPRRSRRRRAAIDPAERRLVYRGEAELGGRPRHVECLAAGAGYDLRLAGIGRFAVAGDGGRITVEEAVPGRSRQDLVEAVLGPALILALALQDVWCLHASAVEIGGRAVAFLGASGAGKSTLARALPELSPGCRRLADDVLPLSLAGGVQPSGVRPAGGPRVLPHFPQLKEGPGEQPGSALPGSLPLAAIYLLEEAAGGELAVEPQAGFAAALALVHHTLAARLFTAKLLRRHVDFSIRLAGAAPVRRLSYPREWKILPRVEETVRRLTLNGRMR